MPTGKQIYEALVAQGIIFILDKTYFGRAADGVEVNLGEVGEEAILYRYLEACPSPADW